jgi:hypothetical protein
MHPEFMRFGRASRRGPDGVAPPTCPRTPPPTRPPRHVGCRGPSRGDRHPVAGARSPDAAHRSTKPGYRLRCIASQTRWLVRETGDYVGGFEHQERPP